MKLFPFLPPVVLGLAFLAQPPHAQSPASDAEASAHPESGRRVLVVDASGSPGSDFVDLQPAIDAARSDDILLVLPGSYSDFVVNGNKSVTLIARDNTAVHVGLIRVLDLPVHHTVVLSGLRSGFGMTIRDSAGPVYVDRSDIGRRTTIEGSPSVVLTNTLLEDDRSQNALDVVGGSFLSFYGSRALGGDGGAVFGDSDGGDGLDLSSNSGLFAAGSTFLGGNGADGQACDPGCCRWPDCSSCEDGDGGDGGDGLRVRSGGEATVLGCTLMRGFGGGPETFDCCDFYTCEFGFSGSNVNGSTTTMTGSSIELTTDEPVYRSGDCLRVRIQGSAVGDSAMLLADTRLAPQFLPQRFRGTAMSLGRPVKLPLGTNDAGSDWTVDVPLGAAPREGEVFILQALVQTQNGRQLSSPASILFRP